MSENAMGMKVSTSDFIRLYEQNIHPKQSYKSAYERAEAAHQKMTGQRRYSGYESFRCVKNYRVRNSRKKK